LPECLFGITIHDMDLISFKLPPVLRRRLAAEARRRGVSRSTIIRETLESALLEEPKRRGELTCADLAGDLVGSVSGPPDLSTNKRYLEEAIVADAGRGRKRRR
jgi:hypothetical protein